MELFPERVARRSIWIHLKSDVEQPSGTVQSSGFPYGAGILDHPLSFFLSFRFHFSVTDVVISFLADAWGASLGGNCKERAMADHRHDFLPDYARTAQAGEIRDSGGHVLWRVM